jgi:hypothetical protein
MEPSYRGDSPQNPGIKRLRPFYQLQEKLQSGTTFVNGLLNMGTIPNMASPLPFLLNVLIDPDLEHFLKLLFLESDVFESRK